MPSVMEFPITGFEVGEQTDPTGGTWTDTIGVSSVNITNFHEGKQSIRLTNTSADLIQTTITFLDNPIDISGFNGGIAYDETNGSLIEPKPNISFWVFKHAGFTSLSTFLALEFRTESLAGFGFNGTAQPLPANLLAVPPGLWVRVVVPLGQSLPLHLSHDGSPITKIIGMSIKTGLTFGGTYDFSIDDVRFTRYRPVAKGGGKFNKLDKAASRAFDKADEATSGWGPLKKASK